MTTEQWPGRAQAWARPARTDLRCPLDVASTSSARWSFCPELAVARNTWQRLQQSEHFICGRHTVIGVEGIREVLVPSFVVVPASMAAADQRTHPRCSDAAEA